VDTPRRITLATRGSKLALRQAQIVVDLLRHATPGIEIEILEVSTKGDKDGRPFSEIGGKGLFTSEVERAVVEGRADIAVHSAKDLTAELGTGCVIAAVPVRAVPFDVVIGGSGSSGEERLGSLPAGATIGSSSMRRRALLAEARADLEPIEFRGNLDTRLRKVEEGLADATILAGAGLARLGHDTSGALDPSWWVPAPGQGAIAVEALHANHDVVLAVAAISDAGAAAELTCERAFGERLEGGCSVPLGCLARAEDGRLVATGYLGDPDGGRSVRDRISGGANEAAALGRELAEAILSSGGDEILEDIKTLEPPMQGAP
jgi:hydroxymethylbilane synthase